MKIIYPKTFNLNATLAEPRAMGMIREEGGKMYMGMKKWLAAYREFYEGFRGYQVSRHAHKVRLSPFRETLA